MAVREVNLDLEIIDGKTTLHVESIRVVDPDNIGNELR